MKERPVMICPEETGHHHHEEEDGATMELLEELNMAGFELYSNPKTMILQPNHHHRPADEASDDDEDEIIPAWVIALVGEGAATVDSSPVMEEEPAIDESKLVLRMEEEADVDAVDMEEEMAAEEEDFASYRSNWESSWGSAGWGHFEDMTTVSSMHYTHLTPKGVDWFAGDVYATLQVFSVKIAEIKGGFKWPLHMYGMVAARDAVDHNRNLLFCRDRRGSQIIKQDDPFLRLTGPSRSIVLTEPVVFEIQLKVEGKTVSEDRALISGSSHYTKVGHAGVHTICFENCFCTIELRFEQVLETVQATIFGVRVIEGGSGTFEYGCRVTCLSPSCSVETVDGKVTYVTNALSPEVVLFDSHRVGMLKDSYGLYGYIDLSRQVVSVEFEGSLKVVVQAYSSSGDIAAQGHVSFRPETYSVSRERFYVGDAQVEINVAWSVIVPDKRDIAVQGWVSEISTV